ncbi:wax ester/triacylglycerol synthase domain-containing protein [Streptomyces sp. NPDC051364]|uniref:wax ester/triacylglycerol synthase domain-containing protein n=1 Tax=Streptomyces sp. NPDC051364 TaxID=3155799 RepID=UPI0034366165
MQSIRMPLNDALFVSSEDHFPGVSVICTVVGWFHGDTPTLTELQDAVRRRWAAIPRLSMKMDRDQGGRPMWATGETFLTERHVRSYPGTDDEGLRKLVSKLALAGVDRDVPPWELLLVPQTGGEFCLLLRFHHALLDGASAGTLLRILLKENATPGPMPAGALVPVSIPKPRVTASGLWEAARAQSPADLWRAVTCAPPTGPGSLAWAHLPFDVLAAARRSLPGQRITVNDVFMAAVAAAFATHPQLLRDRSRPFRVMFPVDLRTPSQEDHLGNITSMDTVALSTDTADRHQRLLRTHHAMQEVKRLGRPAGGLALLTGLARIGGQRAIKRAAAYMMTEHYADVLCSNVRVRWSDAHLLGRPLRKMCMLPPHLHRDHTLVQLTNYAGTLGITAMAPQRHHGAAVSLVAAVCDEIRTLAGEATPVNPL